MPTKTCLNYDLAHPAAAIGSFGGTSEPIGAGIRLEYAAQELEKSKAIKAAAILRNAGSTGSGIMQAFTILGVAEQAAKDALFASSEPASDGGTAGYSLVELAEQPIDKDETLLGVGDCRYLERGGVLLLAAPSGTGKSHIAAQGGASWACGRIAFGLPPTGPLRSLIVQAENPPNDARRIAGNMVHGLDLGTRERALVHENTRQFWLPGCTGERFLITLGKLLDAWPADLVFIDPLAGFADGDLVRPEVVQAFCRAGLGKLAVEHHCGLFVCHHVPKPNAQRDASRMGAYDHQYAASGNADVAANWPRAVLSLQPLARGEFLLRAAKRQPPWFNEHGEQIWELGLRHTDAGIWETFEADPETTRTGRPKAPDPETYRAGVMGLVADSGPMPKTALEERVRAKVTGTRGPARAVLALLVSDGALVCWRGPGKGGCSMLGFPSQAPKPKESER